MPGIKVVGIYHVDHKNITTANSIGKVVELALAAPAVDGWSSP